MTSQSNEIDIAPMLNDINKVLKGHLTSILSPMINEKNAIQNVLLNMPFVKNLKTHNEMLKTQIIQLKTELNGLKEYYERELENASKKNVKLEVRERKSGEHDTPSKIVELKKSMWRQNTKVNAEEEDNDLYNDDVEDEDEEDEDDDEDDMSEYEECNRCEKMNNIDLLQEGSCLKCLADDKENVVEITSNGSIESVNTDDTVKTVTVWNLNNNKKVDGTEEKMEDDEDEDEEDEEKDEDEEEEEEEEDEDEDEDEDEEEEEEEEEDDDGLKKAVAKTVLNVQQSEDYPTIDTASEEEEDVEEDEEEDVEEEDEEDEEDVEEEEDEEDVEEEEEEVEEEEEEGVVKEQDNDEDSDDEDMEVEDVEIEGVQYLTTSPIDGKIYKCDEDGEMEEDENGDFIICGYFKEGIANFI